ncbi:MAG: hypothetical protein K2G63_02800 [Oscillospiraceae bacterium]|nr:hypothetical protein [Oscillospiraceae bacterium]
MAKNKKSENKISKNEQQLNDGIELIEQHPLFSRLRFYPQIVSKDRLGKNVTAKVSSSGDIYLNKDCDHMPKEWSYIISHCMLHLSLGHFDAERMPGYFQKISETKEQWRVSCDIKLWNMACDIFVTRFLNDIKFGSSYADIQALNKFSSASNELKIYEYLQNNHISSETNIFGTAGIENTDMVGLENPITYDNGHKNEFTTRFAFALADSVRSVINQAGSNDENTNRHKNIADEASLWFINHYPLLGGIASGFKIIDTRTDYFKFDDIEIAAIDVTKGEIYVNLSAGFTFEEWKFILAHEYLHAGLQHHARRQGRDFYLWNVACDFLINGWLKEMHIGIMPNTVLYDENLSNQSAEEIYDMLINNIRKNSKLKTFRGYNKGDIIDNGYNPDSSKPTSLDEFCRNALQSGLEYHVSEGRGYIPAGLIEEIKALAMPPIPWDVELAKWFDVWFTPIEKHRSYARPSRRQSSTPDIPRPSWIQSDVSESSRTYGVIIDTSGSMSSKMIGIALGATVSYSVAKDVPMVRVVFCDADAYDIGYVSPEDIAGRVAVQGRGGTILQPAVDLLEKAKNFPKDAPILIITDGYIENNLKIHHNHAFLIPQGTNLPFRPKGKVFYF